MIPHPRDDWDDWAQQGLVSPDPRDDGEPLTLEEVWTNLRAAYADGYTRGLTDPEPLDPREARERAAYLKLRIEDARAG